MEVVLEQGQRSLFGIQPTLDPGLGLQHQDPDAGPGQVVRGYQGVVAPADEDAVDFGRQPDGRPSVSHHSSSAKKRAGAPSVPAIL